jgi:hypothetical protein
MTLAALYVSSPYAFVAQDQRISGTVTRAGVKLDVRGEEQRLRDGTTTRVKVRIHPLLPIAWAASGPALLPYRGQRVDVGDLIEDALSRATGRLDQCLKHLEFLQPLVRREIESEPEYWGDHPNPGLVVLVGIAASGFAGGATLHFGPWGTQATALRDNELVIASSRHSTPFIDALPESERSPRPGANPTKIAHFIRQLLTRAIDYAHARHGAAADVGGHVDIAMVGSRGIGPRRARFL